MSETKKRRIKGPLFWAINDLKVEFDEAIEAFKKWTRNKLHELGEFQDTGDFANGRCLNQLEPLRVLGSGDRVQTIPNIVKRMSQDDVREFEAEKEKVDAIGRKLNQKLREVGRQAGVAYDMINPDTGDLLDDGIEYIEDFNPPADKVAGKVEPEASDSEG